MILLNSLRWVAKITCSSEEVSKKCKEEKAKTNSGQTNQWPHFHVIVRSHIPKQFLKIFIATADDQACVKQWRLVGRAQNNYVLSWINFKALAPEWVWDAQRFGIVDSLSERPQEPRSASIEWCGFPYNRKSLNFWKLVFQWSDICSAYEDCFYVVNALPTTVEPRLSGPSGTTWNSSDNWGSG